MPIRNHFPYAVSHIRGSIVLTDFEEFAAQELILSPTMVSAVQRVNVFLAYSRADQHRAKELVAALEKLDMSVWWDVESIPIGVDRERFLTDQVSVAQCVVVLWSLASLNSKWVRFEAEFAARRSVLRAHRTGRNSHAVQPV